MTSLRRRLLRRPAARPPAVDEQAAAALRAEVAKVPDWFHSIDLGHGVVTDGTKPAELLADELRKLQLPDLRGRSVLDIGAWDGFYSFEAERRGAARVVALDHYAWSLDLPAMRAYWHRCHVEGVRPAPYETVPDVWRPDTLPGKAGFDTAHRAVASRVESVVGDFTTMDLGSLGTFDVTLFLGVLYHLENPFAALRRLRQVTSGVAVIETVCVVVPGAEDHAMWELFPGDELDDDPSNWWAANAKGLVGMCQAAGFADVEVVARPPADEEPARYDWPYGRAVVHARP